MDSDVARWAAIYKLWAWVGTHRKKVLWAGSVLAIVVLAVWFYVWKQGEQEVTASEALSNLRPVATVPGTPGVIAADAYLKLANEYPKTGAGTRALLLAAASFFTEGKYAEAKAQFDRFLRDYPQSPLRGQALLGSAACLSVQGKVAEATAAYEDLIRRHPTDPVVPRAKFALARLYEAQNRIADALKLYEELMRTEAYSSVGAEADIRLQELRRSIQTPVSMAPTNIPVLKTNKP
jgi:TolA-binding protein